MTTSSNKLFVGGLSWGTTDVVLGEEFSKYGQIVEAIVVRDKMTGKSRGFGFVRFQEDDDAQQAKGAMDGQVLDGRMVRVDFASEKRRIPGMSGIGAPGMPFYDQAAMYNSLYGQQQQTQAGQYAGGRGFLPNNQNYALASSTYNPYGMQAGMGMYGPSMGMQGMQGTPNLSMPLQQQYQQSLQIQQQMQAMAQQQQQQQQAFYQQHQQNSPYPQRAQSTQFASPQPIQPYGDIAASVNASSAGINNGTTPTPASHGAAGARSAVESKQQQQQHGQEAVAQ